MILAWSLSENSFAWVSIYLLKWLQFRSRELIFMVLLYSIKVLIPWNKDPLQISTHVKDN